MRPPPLKTRPLDEALRRLGAKLASWEVRALFLGAQASTNLRLGPQHLLGRICGDEPTMGADLADANANLQSLMALWNQLVDDHRTGRIRLSQVRTGEPPTADELNALVGRRNGEITWFLQGIDAGGDDPIEFGDDGGALFRRLAEASAFLESYQELLARTEPGEFGKARKSLDQLTNAIERIICDLLSISQDIRKQAMAEYQQMAGRRTDDGVPVQRPVKVGRNDPVLAAAARNGSAVAALPRRCSSGRPHVL